MKIILFLCVSSASRFKLIQALVFQTSLYFVDTTKCNWNITRINFLFVSGNLLLVSKAEVIFDPDPYITLDWKLKDLNPLLLP